MKYAKLTITFLVLTLNSCSIKTANTADAKNTVSSVIDQNTYVDSCINLHIDTYLSTVQSNTVKKFLTVNMIKSVIDHSEVLPSVVLAQAALESNWGRHSIGFNCFGIKGKGHRVMTTEYQNKKYTKLYQEFKQYTSTEAAIRDHSRLLSTKYDVKLTDASYIDTVDKLKRYATDPQYRNKLKSIIKRHGLYQLDVLAIYKKSEQNVKTFVQYN